MINTAPFLTDPFLIREWLAENFHITGDIAISPDGAVSVTGDVDLAFGVWGTLTHFKVRFDKVSGYFSCAQGLRLLTLAGSPRSVGGDFMCSNCSSLTSLRGAPHSVTGYFSCMTCGKLKSLEGAPLTIGGSLHCTVSSLSGIGQVTGAIQFTEVKEPEPSIVVNLLRQRNKLLTEQQAPWIVMVNDYHASGDLLTAIAQFESYFKVPFPVDVTAALADPPLNTGICL